MTDNRDSLTPSFASLLLGCMQERSVSVADLARDLRVDYKTVRNATEGKSINARFLVSVVDYFGVERQPDKLRDLLIAFLALQLPEDRSDLLQAAGLT